MHDLRIYQIATGSQGGAGLAALGLHNALIKIGVNSTFVTIKKESDSYTNFRAIQIVRSFNERFLSALLTKLNLLLKTELNIQLKKENMLILMIRTDLKQPYIK